METDSSLFDTLTWVITIAILAAILLPQMFKILREYERAVVFRLGKFQKTKGPGLIFLIPFIDRIERVDLRVLTINVDRQEVITKDNVTVHVDAITFFRVIDAEDAVIQVEQYIHATSMLAQTTLRSIVGQVELDELLAEREKVNKNIQEIIDRQTDPWGIKVVSVEVEGEFQAAERLGEAATMMKEAPMALQLRFLQTMTDISEENATFAFIPLPMEMLEVFKNMSGVDLPQIEGNEGEEPDQE